MLHSIGGFARRPFAHFALSCLCALLACTSAPDVPASKPKHPFSDPTKQRIYTFQDQRQTDSLLAYFAVEAYRTQAILAFASVQDTAALPHLQQMLKSPATEARKAAAYTIGQYRMPSNATALQEALRAETAPTVQEALLEALGKSASQENVPFILQWQMESHQAYGMALALYRSTLSGQANEQGLLKACALLADVYEDSVRIMASAYASRAPKLDLSAADSLLQYTMQHDSNPFVRMNCAKAFRKEGYTKALPALQHTAERDENHLVRLEAIRSIKAIGAPASIGAGFRALRDKHAHVCMEAALLVGKLATKADTARISKEMADAKHWRTRVALAGANMKLKANGTDEILNMMHTPHLYEQGELLLVLAQKPMNYEFINERLQQPGNVVLRSYAANAMHNLVALPEAKAFLQKRPEVRKEWVGIFIKAIEQADVATVYHASLALKNEALSLYKGIKDTAPLQKALKKLKLPKDIEAYQELQALIDKVEGKQTPTPIEKSVDHPIDWKWVLQLPVGTKVEVQTNKGSFAMQLLVADAPGTVAEIASLIKSGFYHGKNFHRVVPNFVAQGGCPRGDGFGGLPHTIRSEFAPLSYGEGYVGMASAGKDTESCQWFITHSPTPHLDGRYTIFAKIVSGMQVVHQLEMGDIIENTRLIR